MALFSQRVRAIGAAGSLASAVLDDYGLFLSGIAVMGSSASSYAFDSAAVMHGIAVCGAAVSVEELSITFTLIDTPMSGCSILGSVGSAIGYADFPSTFFAVYYYPQGEVVVGGSDSGQIAMGGSAAGEIPWWNN